MSIHATTGSAGDLDALGVLRICLSDLDLPGAEGIELLRECVRAFATRPTALNGALASGVRCARSRLNPSWADERPVPSRNIEEIGRRHEIASPQCLRPGNLRPLERAWHLFKSGIQYDEIG